MPVAHFDRPVSSEVIAVKYEIRLEQLPSHPLAIVRRRAKIADLPAIIPDACGVVWRSIRAQNIPGAGRHIAVFLDDEMSVEIGVELEAPYTGGYDLVASATPAGLVATAIYYGPYPGLPAVHSAIRNWCATNSRALGGPNWEIYDHWQDAWNNDPSKIRTDVYYLLAE
jgi:effector-binding domain-containing protein